MVIYVVNCRLSLSSQCPDVESSISTNREDYDAVTGLGRKDLDVVLGQESFGIEGEHI